MLDPDLERFATDTQWETMKAVEEHGTHVKAAKALGKDQSTVTRQVQAVNRKAAQHGYAPDFDLEYPTPDGYKIKGVSSLVNKTTGETKLQWIKTEQDKGQQELAFREAINALHDDLPKAEIVSPPLNVEDDILVCYPVGDHHFGMLAWGEETGGENYDIKKAEKLLCSAIDHLVTHAPNSKEGAILILGDFLHYDGMVAVTPSHGHILDADSRFPQVVRAAMKSIRYMVQAALEKHEKVRLIIEIGNHDLSSAIFLMETFYQFFENEPRVEVDRSPKNSHAFKFGKNLIATHHGDKIKSDKLPLIIATDYSKLWGETEHRVVHTGHVHHDHRKEHAGMFTESHGILAPKDSYAANGGWRAVQSMKSITYHKKYGEVGRQMFTPEMLR